MKCIYTLYKKGIALSLSFVFLISGQALPAHAQAPPLPNLKFELLNSTNVARASIPSQWGEVSDFHVGHGGQTLILIQDAHSIPDAQKNIHALIRHFEKKYGVNQVVVEGAASKLDAQFFRSFPDQKLLKKVFGEYYEHAELSGAAAVSAFTNQGVQFQGIENWNLYEEAIQLYQQAIAKEPAISKRLNTERLTLNAAKQKIYSKELLAVDQAIENFYRNTADLPQLLKTLTTYAVVEGSQLGVVWEEIQKGQRTTDNRPQTNDQRLTTNDKEIEVREISEKIERFLKVETPRGLPAASPGVAQRVGRDVLKRFNSKKQAWQTSEITTEVFALYLKELASKLKIKLVMSNELLSQVHNQKKIKQIEGTKLFRELEAYMRATKLNLMKRQPENARRQVFALDQESEELRLFKKLSSLELSREEWNKITTTDQRLPTDDNEKSLQSSDFSLSSAHGAFYQNAEKREEAFFKNLKQILKSTTCNVQRTANEIRSTIYDLRGTATDNCPTILVAGGFHTQGMTEKFKKAGMSYLVVTPKISKLPEKNIYREHMMGNVSWKNYFRVEHGRIRPYDAFVRAVRDRLLQTNDQRLTTDDSLHSPPTIHKSLSKDSVNLLKLWRDQIIRDLADQGRAQDAWKYTKFLDEKLYSTNDQRLSTNGVQREGIAERLSRRVDQLISGLRALNTSGKINQSNISTLLQSMTVVDAYAGPASFMPLAKIKIGFASRGQRVEMRQVEREGVATWAGEEGVPFYEKIKVPARDDHDTVTTEGFPASRKRSFLDDHGRAVALLKQISEEDRARIATGNLMLVGPGKHPFELLLLFDLFPEMQSLTVMDTNSENLKAIQKTLTEINFSPALMSKIKFVHKHGGFLVPAAGDGEWAEHSFDLIFSNRVFDYSAFSPRGRWGPAIEDMQEMIKNLAKALKPRGVHLTLGSDWEAVVDFETLNFHWRDRNGSMTKARTSAFIASQNPEVFVDRQMGADGVSPPTTVSEDLRTEMRIPEDMLGLINVGEVHNLLYPASLDLGAAWELVQQFPNVTDVYFWDSDFKDETGRRGIPAIRSAFAHEGLLVKEVETSAEARPAGMDKPITTYQITGLFSNEMNAPVVPLERKLRFHFVQSDFLQKNPLPSDLGFFDLVFVKLPGSNGGLSQIAPFWERVMQQTRPKGWVVVNDAHLPDRLRRGPVNGLTLLGTNVEGINNAAWSNEFAIYQNDRRPEARRPTDSYQPSSKQSQRTEMRKGKTKGEAILVLGLEGMRAFQKNYERVFSWVVPLFIITSIFGVAAGTIFILSGQSLTTYFSTAWSRNLTLLAAVGTFVAYVGLVDKIKKAYLLSGDFLYQACFPAFRRMLAKMFLKKSRPLSETYRVPYQRFQKAFRISISKNIRQGTREGWLDDYEDSLGGKSRRKFKNQPWSARKAADARLIELVQAIRQSGGSYAEAGRIVLRAMIEVDQMPGQPVLQIKWKRWLNRSMLLVEGAISIFAPFSFLLLTGYALGFLSIETVQTSSIFTQFYLTGLFIAHGVNFFLKYFPRLVFKIKTKQVQPTHLISSWWPVYGVMALVAAIAVRGKIGIWLNQLFNKMADVSETIEDVSSRFRSYDFWDGFWSLLGLVTGVISWALHRQHPLSQIEMFGFIISAGFWGMASFMTFLATYEKIHRSNKIQIATLQNHRMADSTSRRPAPGHGRNEMRHPILNGYPELESHFVDEPPKLEGLSPFLKKPNLAQLYIPYEPLSSDGKQIRFFKVAQFLAEEESAYEIANEHLLHEAGFLLRLNRAGVQGIPKLIQMGMTQEGALWLELEGPLRAESFAGDKWGNMDWDMKIDLLIQLIHIIEAVHKQGIVHHDLKPANFLFWMDESLKPRATLIDFGTAQAVSDIYSPFGTVRYMSPEAFRKEPAQTISDVFFLGMVLREMFWDDREWIPFGMRGLILSLIEISPNNRLKTMKDVATKLIKIKERRQKNKKINIWQKAWERIYTQFWQWDAQEFLRDRANLMEQYEPPPQTHRAEMLEFSDHEPVGVQEYKASDFALRLGIQPEMFDRKGRSFFDFDRIHNRLTFKGAEVAWGQPFPKKRMSLDKWKKKWGGKKAPEAILTNGNLGMNAWFTAVLDGKVYFYKSDEDVLKKRDYFMLVTWKDGQRTSVENLKFKKVGVVFRAFLNDEDVTDKIQSAVYGQAIVKDGKSNVQNLSDQFDDMRHLLRMPMFEREKRQIHLGFSDSTGEMVKHRELVTQALHGESVTLHLAAPLAKFSISETELHEVYADWGYSKKDSTANLKQGDYYFDPETQNLTICFYPGTHPHSFIGIKADGTMIAGAVGGSTHFSGATLERLAQELIQQGAQHVFLWANGKDVDVQINGHAYSSDRPHKAGISTIVFLPRPELRMPHFILTQVARSFIRQIQGLEQEYQEVIWNTQGNLPENEKMAERAYKKQRKMLTNAYNKMMRRLTFYSELAKQSSFYSALQEYQSQFSKQHHKMLALLELKAGKTKDLPDQLTPFEKSRVEAQQKEAEVEVRIFESRLKYLQDLKQKQKAGGLKSASDLKRFEKDVGMAFAKIQKQHQEMQHLIFALMRDDSTRAPWNRVVFDFLFKRSDLDQAGQAAFVRVANALSFKEGFSEKYWAEWSQSWQPAHENLSHLLTMDYGEGKSAKRFLTAFARDPPANQMLGQYIGKAIFQGWWVRTFIQLATYSILALAFAIQKPSDQIYPQERQAIVATSASSSTAKPQAKIKTDAQMVQELQAKLQIVTTQLSQIKTSFNSPVPTHSEEQVALQKEIEGLKQQIKDQKQALHQAEIKVRDEEAKVEPVKKLVEQIQKEVAEAFESEIETINQSGMTISMKEEKLPSQELQDWKTPEITPGKKTLSPSLLPPVLEAQKTENPSALGGDAAPSMTRQGSLKLGQGVNNSMAPVAQVSKNLGGEMLVTQVFDTFSADGTLTAANPQWREFALSSNQESPYWVTLDNTDPKGSAIPMPLGYQVTGYGVKDLSEGEAGFFRNKNHPEEWVVTGAKGPMIVYLAPGPVSESKEIQLQGFTREDVLKKLPQDIRNLVEHANQQKFSETQKLDLALFILNEFYYTQNKLIGQDERYQTCAGQCTNLGWDLADLLIALQLEKFEMAKGFWSEKNGRVRLKNLHVAVKRGAKILNVLTQQSSKLHERNGVTDEDWAKEKEMLKRRTQKVFEIYRKKLEQIKSEAGLREAQSQATQVNAEMTAEQKSLAEKEKISRGETGMILKAKAAAYQSTLNQFREQAGEMVPPTVSARYATQLAEMVESVEFTADAAVAKTGLKPQTYFVDSAPEMLLIGELWLMVLEKLEEQFPDRKAEIAAMRVRLSDKMDALSITQSQISDKNWDMLIPWEGTINELGNYASGAADIHIDEITSSPSGPSGAGSVTVTSGSASEPLITSFQNNFLPSPASSIANFQNGDQLQVVQSAQGLFVLQSGSGLNQFQALGGLTQNLVSPPSKKYQWIKIIRNPTFSGDWLAIASDGKEEYFLGTLADKMGFPLWIAVSNPIPFDNAGADILSSGKALAWARDRNSQQPFFIFYDGGQAYGLSEVVNDKNQVQLRLTDYEMLGKPEVKRLGDGGWIASLDLKHKTTGALVSLIIEIKDGRMIERYRGHSYRKLDLQVSPNGSTWGVIEIYANTNAATAKELYYGGPVFDSVHGIVDKMRLNDKLRTNKYCSLHVLNDGAWVAVSHDAPNNESNLIGTIPNLPTEPGSWEVHPEWLQDINHWMVSKIIGDPGHYQMVVFGKYPSWIPSPFELYGWVVPVGASDQLLSHSTVGGDGKGNYFSFPQESFPPTQPVSITIPDGQFLKAASADGQWTVLQMGDDDRWSNFEPERTYTGTLIGQKQTVSARGYPFDLAIRFNDGFALLKPSERIGADPLWGKTPAELVTRGTTPVLAPAAINLDHDTSVLTYPSISRLMSYGLGAPGALDFISANPQLITLGFRTASEAFLVGDPTRQPRVKQLLEQLVDTLIKSESSSERERNPDALQFFNPGETLRILARTPEMLNVLDASHLHYLVKMMHHADPKTVLAILSRLDPGSLDGIFKANIFTPSEWQNSWQQYLAAWTAEFNLEHRAQITIDEIEMLIRFQLEGHPQAEAVFNYYAKVRHLADAAKKKLFAEIDYLKELRNQINGRSAIPTQILSMAGDPKALNELADEFLKWVQNENPGLDGLPLTFETLPPQDGVESLLHRVTQILRMHPQAVKVGTDQRLDLRDRVSAETEPLLQPYFGTSQKFFPYSRMSKQMLIRDGPALLWLLGLGLALMAALRTVIQKNWTGWWASEKVLNQLAAWPGLRPENAAKMQRLVLDFFHADSVEARAQKLKAIESFETDLLPTERVVLNIMRSIPIQPMRLSWIHCAFWFLGALPYASLLTPVLAGWRFFKNSELERRRFLNRMMRDLNRERRHANSESAVKNIFSRYLGPYQKNVSKSQGDAGDSSARVTSTWQESVSSHYQLNLDLPTFNHRSSGPDDNGTTTLSAGADFWDMRAYRPGDDPRMIHWPSYLRDPEGDPVVRVNRENASEPVSLLIDLRGVEKNRESWTQQMAHSLRAFGYDSKGNLLEDLGIRVKHYQLESAFLLLPNRPPAPVSFAGFSSKEKGQILMAAVAKNISAGNQSGGETRFSFYSKAQNQIYQQVAIYSVDQAAGDIDSLERELRVGNLIVIGAVARPEAIARFRSLGSRRTRIWQGHQLVPVRAEMRRTGVSLQSKAWVKSARIQIRNQLMRRQFLSRDVAEKIFEQLKKSELIDPKIEIHFSNLEDGLVGIGFSTDRDHSVPIKLLKPSNGIRQILADGKNIYIESLQTTDQGYRRIYQVIEQQNMAVRDDDISIDQFSGQYPQIATLFKPHAYLIDRAADFVHSPELREVSIFIFGLTFFALFWWSSQFWNFREFAHFLRTLKIKTYFINNFPKDIFMASLTVIGVGAALWMVAKIANKIYAVFMAAIHGLGIVLAVPAAFIFVILGRIYYKTHYSDWIQILWGPSNRLSEQDETVLFELSGKHQRASKQFARLHQKLAEYVNQPENQQELESKAVLYLGSHGGVLSAIIAAQPQQINVINSDPENHNTLQAALKDRPAPDLFDSVTSLNMGQHFFNSSETGNFSFRTAIIDRGAKLLPAEWQALLAYSTVEKIVFYRKDFPGRLKISGFESKRINGTDFVVLTRKRAEMRIRKAIRAFLILSPRAEWIRASLRWWRYHSIESLNWKEDKDFKDWMNERQAEFQKQILNAPDEKWRRAIVGQVTREIYEVFRHVHRHAPEIAMAISDDSSQRSSTVAGNINGIIIGRFFNEDETRLVNQLQEISAFVLGGAWTAINLEQELVGEEIGYQAVAEILNSRFVAGAQEYIRGAKQKINRSSLDQKKKWIWASIREWDDLRQKNQGYSGVFNREPDLMHGPGGLHDFDAAVDVIHFYKGDVREALKDMWFLRSSDWARAQKAQKYLAQVRSLLHEVQGKENSELTDRLSFAVQNEIAERMGYRDTAKATALELFMNDLHVQQQSLHFFSSKIFRRALRRTGELNYVTVKPVEHGIEVVHRVTAIGKEGEAQTVTLDGGLGAVSSKLALTLYPRSEITAEQIPGIFQRAIENDYDITGELMDKIEMLRPAFQEKMQTDAGFAARARRTLREALASPNRVGYILFRMHALGILSDILPEYAAVRPLAENDIEHEYTLDAYSIEALKYLDDLMDPESSQSESMKAHARYIRDHGLLLPLRAAIIASALADKDKNRAQEILDGMELPGSRAEKGSAREMAGWLIENRSMILSLMRWRGHADSTAFNTFWKIELQEDFSRWSLITMFSSVRTHFFNPAGEMLYRRNMQDVLSFTEEMMRDRQQMGDFWRKRQSAEAISTAVASGVEENGFHVAVKSFGDDPALLEVTVTFLNRSDHMGVFEKLTAALASLDLDIESMDIEKSEMIQDRFWVRRKSKNDPDLIQKALEKQILRLETFGGLNVLVAGREDVADLTPTDSMSILAEPYSDRDKSLIQYKTRANEVDKGLSKASTFVRVTTQNRRRFLVFAAKIFRIHGLDVMPRSSVDTIGYSSRVGKKIDDVFELQKDGRVLQAAELDALIADFQFAFDLDRVDQKTIEIIKWRQWQRQQALFSFYDYDATSKASDYARKFVGAQNREHVYGLKYMSPDDRSALPGGTNTFRCYFSAQELLAYHRQNKLTDAELDFLLDAEKNPFYKPLIPNIAEGGNLIPLEAFAAKALVALQKNKKEQQALTAEALIAALPGRFKKMDTASLLTELAGMGFIVAQTDGYRIHPDYVQGDEYDYGRLYARVKMDRERVLYDQRSRRVYRIISELFARIFEIKSELKPVSRNALVAVRTRSQIVDTGTVDNQTIMISENPLMVRTAALAIQESWKRNIPLNIEAFMQLQNFSKNISEDDLGWLRDRFKNWLDGDVSLMPLIRTLDEIGLLAKLFPELAPLHRIYDGAAIFHDYSVGAHTLLVLESIEKMITGNLISERINANPELKRLISNPNWRRALRYAALLHDSAKANDSGAYMASHQIQGARIMAPTALRRMGETPELIENVQWLIWYHQHINDAAFDVTGKANKLEEDVLLEWNDSEKRQATPERLGLLYLFSFADRLGLRAYSSYEKDMLDSPQTAFLDTWYKSAKNASLFTEGPLSAKKHANDRAFIEERIKNFQPFLDRRHLDQVLSNEIAFPGLPEFKKRFADNLTAMSVDELRQAMREFADVVGPEYLRRLSLSGITDDQTHNRFLFYWYVKALRNSPETVDAAGSEPAIAVYDYVREQQNFLEVNLGMAYDRPDILSEVFGVLAAYGMSLHDAEIQTLDTGLVFNRIRTIFWTPQTLEVSMQIQRDIAQVISGKKTVKNIFDEQKREYAFTTPWTQEAAQGKMHWKKHAGNGKKGRIEIELNNFPDRVGLLYILSLLFSQGMNANILNAKARTYALGIQDVVEFDVSDAAKGLPDDAMMNRFVAVAGKLLQQPRITGDDIDHAISEIQKRAEIRTELPVKSAVNRDPGVKNPSQITRHETPIPSLKAMRTEMRPRGSLKVIQDWQPNWFADRTKINVIFQNDTNLRNWPIGDGDILFSVYQSDLDKDLWVFGFKSQTLRQKIEIWTVDDKGHVVLKVSGHYDPQAKRFRVARSDALLPGEAVFRRSVAVLLRSSSLTEWNSALIRSPESERAYQALAKMDGLKVAEHIQGDEDTYFSVTRRGEILKSEKPTTGTSSSVAGLAQQAKDWVDEPPKQRVEMRPEMREPDRIRNGVREWYENEILTRVEIPLRDKMIILEGIDQGYFKVFYDGRRIDEKVRGDEDPAGFQLIFKPTDKVVILSYFFLNDDAQGLGVGRAIVQWIASLARDQQAKFVNHKTHNPNMLKLFLEVLNLAQTQLQLAPRGSFFEFKKVNIKDFWSEMGEISFRLSSGERKVIQVEKDGEIKFEGSNYTSGSIVALGDENGTQLQFVISHDGLILNIFEIKQGARKRLNYDLPKEINVSGPVRAEMRQSIRLPIADPRQKTDTSHGLRTRRHADASRRTEKVLDYLARPVLAQGEARENVAQILTTDTESLGAEDYFALIERLRATRVAQLHGEEKRKVEALTNLVLQVLGRSLKSKRSLGVAIDMPEESRAQLERILKNFSPADQLLLILPKHLAGLKLKYLKILSTNLKTLRPQRRAVFDNPVVPSLETGGRVSASAVNPDLAGILSDLDEKSLDLDLSQEAAATVDILSRLMIAALIAEHVESRQDLSQDDFQNAIKADLTYFGAGEETIHFENGHVFVNLKLLLELALAHQTAQQTSRSA